MFSATLRSPTQALPWATPRSSDGEKGGPNQSFGAGGVPLPAQVVDWMTPRVERGGYTRDKGNPEKQRETLEGQVAGLTYSRHIPATEPDGSPPLKERRSLNPLFVEWLMGWPPGWTLLVWTDLGCSETALFLYKQHMRSALLSLGLPAEAPPPQLSLFG